MKASTRRVGAGDCLIRLHAGPELNSWPIQRISMLGRELTLYRPTIYRTRFMTYASSHPMGLKHFLVIKKIGPKVNIRQQLMEIRLFTAHSTQQQHQLQHSTCVFEPRGSITHVFHKHVISATIFWTSIVFRLRGQSTFYGSFALLCSLKQRPHFSLLLK